jgi:hypothetical protein
MDFNRFKTDTQAEVSGKWFPFQDAKLKIARTGNMRYREMLRSKLSLSRSEIDKGLVDLAVSDEMLCEVIAETILLDWEGFTKDGQEYAYSKQAAREMLMKYRDFRDVVVEKADSMENFLEAAKKEDEKKPKPGSPGTSSTATA